MGEGSDRNTTIDRTSERELVVTRTFNAPARIVYEAWTKADLFMQWWAPKSMGMQMSSCEMDVRVGGGYRITFGNNAATDMAFFGKYLDVIPNARLVWTNEEDADAPVTTVTFEEDGGKTLMVLHEIYPSKAAFEQGSGAEAALAEQFAQLDDLLDAMGARAG